MKPNRKHPFTKAKAAGWAEIWANSLLAGVEMMSKLPEIRAALGLAADIPAKARVIDYPYFASRGFGPGEVLSPHPEVFCFADGLASFDPLPAVKVRA